MLRFVLSVLCVFALAGFVSAQGQLGRSSGGKPKDKGEATTGAFKSYDEKSMTLTITTGKGDAARDVKFTLTGALKVTTWNAEGTEKTEAVAKEAKFKDIKPNTQVTVYADADAKLIAVIIGAKAKGSK